MNNVKYINNDKNDYDTHDDPATLHATLMPDGIPLESAHGPHDNNLQHSIMN